MRSRPNIAGGGGGCTCCDVVPGVNVEGGGGGVATATATATTTTASHNDKQPHPVFYFISCRLTFGGEEVDQCVAVSEGFLLEHHFQKVLDAPPPPGEAASVEAPPVRVRQLGKVHYFLPPRERT